MIFKGFFIRLSSRSKLRNPLKKRESRAVTGFLAFSKPQLQKTLPARNLTIAEIPGFHLQ